MSPTTKSKTRKATKKTAKTPKRLAKVAKPAKAASASRASKSGRTKRASVSRTKRSKPTPATPEASAPPQDSRFVKDLLVRGEAVELPKSGKLPTEATHVITGTRGGIPTVKRARLKLY